MKYTCSLITVAYIQRSCNFCENLLQQKVQFDFGENVSFEGGFAIHLDIHYKSLIDNSERTLYRSNSNPLLKTALLQE